MKFAVQSADRNSHEGQTVVWFCSINNVDRAIVHNPKDVPPGYVPVGRVDWVEQILGHPVRPDYYPSFLQSWLHRKIWQPDSWPHNRVFIKPADRHKRFTGFVTKGGWKGKKKGPWWASEVVQFVDEWRYYVCRGEVRAAKWGSGIDQVEKPAPALSVAWPADFCVAVDFGTFPDGRIALIESNSPFSCGWYGSVIEGTVYAHWLADCWEWLKSSS